MNTKRILACAKIPLLKRAGIESSMNEIDRIKQFRITRDYA